MQRRFLLLAAGAAVALPFINRNAKAQAGAVTGAGSSLPRAVFGKWAEMAGASAGLKVTYEANGAAAAVEQIKARAIDFASVDYPRRVALLREHRLIQFPAVLTSVVPFVNLPGVAAGQLNLTGEILAEIYLGKITKWNDAKIKAANGGFSLPATNIVPIHRGDTSGANVLFTTFLSRVSEAWAAGPRAGAQVQWPEKVGAAVEDPAAMAAKVKATPGAIGYAGTTTVKASGLPSASLQNAAGEFVKPTAASFAKAAEAEDWSVPGFNVDLVNEHAAGAWPIVGAGFVLVAENPTAERVAAARNAFKFFDWAFKHGGAVLDELGYAGIPQSAIGAVEGVWRRAKDPSGQPIWEA